MKSLCSKKMLALPFAGGIGLVLLGTAAVANPLILDWRVIGTGPVAVSSTCEMSFASGCTSTSTGTVLGQHVGSGTYSLSLTTGNDGSSNYATNSSGGKCIPANGTNTTTTVNDVVAASGDIIYFNTVGWLCEEGASGSPYHYNGTYRITGGTGRFSNVVGGGSLTATFEKGGLVNNTYMKIDGTINF
jgi:hypothetical protein